MDKLLAILQQLKAFWVGLSNVKRFALVGATLGVALSVLGVSYFSTREHYVFLFTELSPDDAAAIAGKLKELKVPYQITNGGSAVEVPEEQVHELRMELTRGGLPKGGGVGFEIFDKPHLGSTEFEQKINLRRALEGELSRTIGSIGAVQSARVHLVLAERTVFTTNKDPASASIVVKLRAGRTLGNGEIAGMVHLVAAAVPGLSEDRISIVSGDGATLHSPRTEGTAGAGSQLEADHAREVAVGLETKARAMLERTLGAGHVAVQVTVDLDPSARERTEEHYEPAKTALRSEQKSVERSAQEGTSVAGVPGAAANIPGPGGAPGPQANAPQQPGQPAPPANVAAEEPGANGTLVRQAVTRNWEVDRVTERTTTGAGKLARLSVAVMVDGKYEGTGADKKFVPRDKQELERLGELVKGAVGFNDVRGDIIKIDSHPFIGMDIEEPKPAPPSLILGKPAKTVWLYVGGGGALLTTLMLLVLVTRSRRRSRELAVQTAAAAAEAAEAATTPELEAGLPPRRALPSPDEQALRDQFRDEALALAQRDPATAAVILRQWINASTATQVAA